MRTLAIAAALTALAASGCGGATHTAAPAPPRLPRALAQAWALEADEIASALAAGDGCTAEVRAVALRTQVVQAVNERRIPQRLLEPLVGTVNDLPDRIACSPAPAPAPKHGRKHKHGDHGGGGD